MVDKVLFDKELTLSSKGAAAGQKMWWIMRHTISDSSMHQVTYTAYLSHNVLRHPGELLHVYTTNVDFNKWRVKHGWDEALIKKEELEWNYDLVIPYTGGNDENLD